ncbi:hypothetical protein BOH66_05115 [Microbacterium aurum]|uniref:Uncharacterized protein n=1 Tax=Microbacterium aurum TaxID=36805 RepID=A0A1P8U6N7_9MICO|nr:hypothetical protein [Microbacterium aurum]APZ33713.1 hypothetical protein BOH66_05115 [Microbacterium aurum]MBM7827432.1 hypothetical protein [Microbacterium aurum]
MVEQPDTLILDSAQSPFEIERGERDFVHGHARQPGDHRRQQLGCSGRLVRRRPLREAERLSGAVEERECDIRCARRGRKQVGKLGLRDAAESAGEADIVRALEDRDVGLLYRVRLPPNPGH